MKHSKHDKTDDNRRISVRAPVCRVALSESEDDQGAAHGGEASTNVVKVAQRGGLGVGAVLGRAQGRDRELRGDGQDCHEDGGATKDPGEVRTQGAGQQAAEPVAQRGTGGHEAEDARLADARAVDAT